MDKYFIKLLCAVALPIFSINAFAYSSVIQLTVNNDKNSGGVVTVLEASNSILGNQSPLYVDPGETKNANLTLTIPNGAAIVLQRLGDRTVVNFSAEPDGQNKLSVGSLIGVGWVGGNMPSATYCKPNPNKGSSSPNTVTINVTGFGYGPILNISCLHSAS